MSLLHPTIPDAHGVRRPLARREPLLPDTADPTRHARLMRAGYVDASLQVPDALAWPLYMMIALVVLILIVASLALVLWLTWPAWVMLTFLPVIGAIALATTTAITRRLAARAVARMYLRARYCPSCGYDLADSTLDAADATPCPECGASWNLPPS